MKRMKLFLISLLITVSMSAQFPEGYHPIAKEGNIWNYQMVFWKTENSCQYHYVVRGDTVINDVTYKKLLFERSDFSMYVAALRDDLLKTYYIPFGQDSEILFSAHDLETEGYIYDSIADMQYWYRGTGSVNTDGIPLRKTNYRYSPKYGPYPTSITESAWIEGIGGGVDKDLFCQNSLSSTTVFSKLISCYQDGERIYHSEEDSAPPAFISLPLEHEFKAGYDESVSPDSIWVEYAENNVATIYITGAKAGYQCNIDDEVGSRKSYWLDIPQFLGNSCYSLGQLMKGKNTITIENDYEKYSFTFIYPFDQHTSINSPSEKSVNRKFVNSQWFDLSGRRLTTPPTRPGLYIKDGRKVLIK